MDFKRLIEYLPLISVCLLYFGFCNSYAFYKEFNVEIYSFITNTDILLSFFPKIVVFTSFIYSFLLNQLYLSIKKPATKSSNVENVSKEIKDKATRRLEWWRRNIYWFLISYYIVTTIILRSIQKVYNYKAYELSDLNMFFDIVFLLLIYIAINIHERKDSFFEKPFLIALFLILFIGQKIGTYRIFDAQKIKAGLSDFKKDHIAFKYKDRIIKTNDTLLFVGQTSSHILLYNVKDSTTKIYQLLSVDSLNIK